MPQRVLAIEWDLHELRGAVLETSFRDYRIVGFYREPIVDAEVDLAQHLRSFVAKHELQGATVLSCMAGNLASVRNFDLPFRDRKRLDQTVPFELEAQVPFGLDQVVTDYQIVHSDKTGSHILAVLVQRKDLEEHLKLLSDAGLDPKVVDFAPLASLNLLTLLPASEKPDSFLFITCEGNEATVARYRNKQLVGIRTVYLSQNVQPEDAEKAALTNGHPAGESERAAELCSEIRWTLMAHGGAAVEPGTVCYFLGDGVDGLRLAQHLESALGLTIRHLNQLALKAIPPEIKAQLGGFTTTFGLALREVAATDVTGVNFRQGEFAYHRGHEELQRAMLWTGAIGAVAIALWFISMYMGYDRLARQAALLDAQIRYVFAQTMGEGHKIVDPKSQMQAEIDAIQHQLQVLGDIIPMGGITAIDALRTLSMAFPESLKIDIDEYMMDTDGIRVKAKAESFEAVDLVKQQIDKANYFADAQVKDIKAAPDGKGVDFRIVLVLSKASVSTGAKE